MFTNLTSTMPESLAESHEYDLGLGKMLLHDARDVALGWRGPGLCPLHLRKTLRHPWATSRASCSIIFPALGHILEKCLFKQIVVLKIGEVCLVKEG